MTKKQIIPILVVLALAVGAWITVRYALPVVLPFLLGACVALGAEPTVALLHRKLHLRRWAAAGLGVTAVLVLLLALVLLIVALLVRQAGHLTRILPELTEAAQQGLNRTQLWLTELACRAPEGLQPMLHRATQELFSGSGAAVSRVTDGIISLLSGALARIPNGALGISTGILAAYMISARLPGLRAAARVALPEQFRSKYLPAMKELKHSLLGWITAQLKLSAITAALLILGFWALQIPHGPLWAVLTALVDALPVLGTGAVLLPWAIICLLQGRTVRAVGLLGIYAVVWLVRSVLEPKLIGKQLGLDPLLTLGSMYAGYRLFGLPGLILSPVAAVCALRLAAIFRQ